MQLTQKIKVKVTPAQELILNALSEKCRLIYNFALKERQVYFEEGKRINYVKQQNDLPTLKIKFPEYKWVYSKVLQHTLRNLDADYKSFFALNKKGEKEARPPSFKSKKYFTTMVYNQSGYKTGKGFIELSHKHPLGTKLWFKIPNRFLFDKVYQVTIFKDKKKEYYLSIVYEKEEKTFIDNTMIQTFDLGLMKQTAVNLSGKFVEFINKRPDRYWQKPKQQLQSRIDHCKKFSRKWFKLKKSLNYCTIKSANQLKDFQHKLSRKIVDNTKAKTIVIGDLNIKQMSQKSKSKGMSRSLQNTGSISRLVGFLAYKSKLIGKRIIKIDEKYTSKTCCICGVRKDMPLEQRQYICDCGNNIDRDKNSAVNIMIRYLSNNGLWKSYWQFVSNLRQTGLTIVSHSQEALTSKC